MMPWRGQFTYHMIAVTLRRELPATRLDRKGVLHGAVDVGVPGKAGALARALVAEAAAGLGLHRAGAVVVDGLGGVSSRVAVLGHKRLHLARAGRRALRGVGDRVDRAGLPFLPTGVGACSLDNTDAVANVDLARVHQVAIAVHREDAVGRGERPPDGGARSRGGERAARSDGSARRAVGLVARSL